MPLFIANTLAILPVASYGPVSQPRQPMMLGGAHPRLMLARVGSSGRTYSIVITRTTCDRIGPVHLPNRASYEQEQEDIFCLSRGRNARRYAGKRAARRRGSGPLLCAGPIRSRSRAIRRFWQLRMGDTALLGRPWLAGPPRARLRLIRDCGETCS